MKAFVFPGQGAQFVGMGKDLYENSALAKELFEKANDILGYRITDIMFDGTDEDLRQTKVTQPAVFLHSVISALCMGDDFKPEMTAGHSLGEFSALVAAGALSFEDGLKLVYARAMAMQKACEATPSTMAAIIALPDEKVEEICATVNAEGEVCVPANYNCPGQIVISGSVPGIEKACELMKAAGAKRALPLKVGGAFHSPLMDPAKIELEAAIKAVTPEFDNKPSEDAYMAVTGDGDSLKIYPATKGGKFVGAAVESNTKKGFSGEIKVIVGFDKEGKLLNYSVLQHAETPGLGAKMQEWFSTDKNKQSVLGRSLSAGPLKVTKDGGDVDAITAATITSRAFLDAVNRAYSAFAGTDGVTGATTANTNEGGNDNE